MLLQRAGLYQVENPDGLLLAKPVQPSDPLLDFHRVPRQIKIHEAVAELQITTFRAAARQQQRTALLAKVLGDPVARLSRRAAVNHEARNPGRAQGFSEGGLSLNKLAKDDRSAIHAREGRH